jgi:hypothetical protein
VAPPAVRASASGRPAEIGQAFYQVIGLFDRSIAELGPDPSPGHVDVD